ncbi:endonuclease domain-containing protein [Streptomyces sp. NPDC007856]|uniref:endonuclease domain-containing protein n=1 Tax=Streptomyces sp. NPDC007856 TaxID=3364781 RepID=UPI0036CEBB94
MSEAAGLRPGPNNGPTPRFPRWYAWWRLHDLQDGNCATCDAPAYAIDHDYTTGLVRGLLCVVVLRCG